MADSINKKDDVYFGAKEATKLSEILLSKANQYHNSVFSSGYLDKVYKLYSTYHGMSYYDTNNGHEIMFEGEQGELTSISVNHLRNIGQNMLNLVTASRPSLEARAINTDYKSLTQTKLANGLLDYYMREKNLEDKLIKAVEHAIATGTGYIRLEWNATRGEEIDFDEETQTSIHEGDVEFELLSTLDVTFDNTKENYDENEWLMVRTFKNKYDLMAKYPEYADQIKGLRTKDESEAMAPYIFGVDETTDVPVYEFYHERTEALPDGRYTMFLSRNIILSDGPLPYQRIPIYRITPSDILGTPFGYTPLFDLLPLQDAANMLYSVILTNQNAFGVQNIYVPRGSDISMEALPGGLNIIEGNPHGGTPQPINLTSTPKEIFEFLGMIIQTMETISGINSVIRGNPEANLRSGSALALIQSNSIQFMSGLARQYNQLIEKVGTGLIQTLKMYASTKRVAAIVGIQNRSYLKEFTGDDLSNISRVVVSAGNPLSKTTAGKVQMADNLLQYGLLNDPQQYLQIIETGSLDSVLEGPLKEVNLIVSENEKLLFGELPPVLDLDKHSQHIMHHKSLLADARMRENPELVANVMAHINMHIEALRQADPTLLAMIGEQSIAPQPAPNMGQQMMPPNVGGPADIPTEPILAPDGSPIPQEALPQAADQVPNPPAGFEGAPTTPQDLQALVSRG